MEAITRTDVTGSRSGVTMAEHVLKTPPKRFRADVKREASSTG